MKKNTALKQIVGDRKFFITNNDLDGILSWLFLEQRRYKLGGIYDLKTIYLKEGIELDECFAVDLDMSIPGIPAIGHHFTLFSNETHFNPNDRFGVSDPDQYQTLNDYMKPPRFRQKCPLPTILILHWLTDTPLPEDPFVRSWMIYTDGLYRSYSKYKGNVKSWLREMDMETLIEDLESKTKEESVHEIVSTIQRLGKRLGGRGFKTTVHKPYPQCSFKPLELPLLEPFLRYLFQLFYQSSDIHIPDLATSTDGHYYQFQMNDLVYQKLKQKFDTGELLSHGLVYQNAVSATLTSPLSDSRDLDLLRARTLRSIS